MHSAAHETRSGFSGVAWQRNPLRPGASVQPLTCVVTKAVCLLGHQFPQRRAERQDMNAAQKKAEAAEILRLARSEGSVVTLSGEWVKFEPPLSFDLLMRQIDANCGDEMAALLMAEPDC